MSQHSDPTPAVPAVEPTNEQQARAWAVLAHDLSRIAHDSVQNGQMRHDVGLKLMRAVSEHVSELQLENQAFFDGLGPLVECDVFDQTIGYRNYESDGDWFIWWDEGTTMHGCLIDSVKSKVAQLHAENARLHDDRRQLLDTLSRLAEMTGKPGCRTIVGGPITVAQQTEYVVESVANLIRAYDDVQERLEAVTPDVLQRFATSEEHHEEHHRREAELEAERNRYRAIVGNVVRRARNGGFVANGGFAKHIAMICGLDEQAARALCAEFNVDVDTGEQT